MYSGSMVSFEVVELFCYKDNYIIQIFLEFCLKLKPWLIKL